jgi:hypothetical protein
MGEREERNKETSKRPGKSVQQWSVGIRQVGKQSGGLLDDHTYDGRTGRCPESSRHHLVDVCRLCTV